MYYEHFGFQLPPFSISPDPQFLYLTQRHRDALAHLIYGAGENGGFVLLTGQVGTGKTTLIRSLLSQELPGIDIALCLHSGLSVMDFVASILDELRIDYPDSPASLKPLVDALNTHLLQKHAEGRQTVLIIDEGQNLSREVLEQVRLLTNLETDNQKLLRIILVGQEELQDSINRPDLRQLSQRITGRYHLTALNAKEVSEYITHRLKTAKGNPTIFSTAAVKQVCRHSGGIPRLINVLCDRSLLVAYNSDAYRVSAKHVKIAVAETMPQAMPYSQQRTGFSDGTLQPLFSRFLLPLGVLTLGLFAYGAYHFLSYAEQSGINTVVASSPIVSTTVPTTVSPTMPTITSVTQSAMTPEVTEISDSGNVPRETTTAVQPETTVQTTVQTSAVSLNNSNFEEALSDEAVSANDETPTADAAIDTTTATGKAPTLAAVALLQPAPSAEPKLIDQGRSQADGVKALLKRWALSVDIPADKTVCQYAESQQMQCLMTRGGIPLVRTINRPLLLELKDSGKTSWLPIVGFDRSGQAICVSGETTQICDTGDIAQYWSGNLLVLLRKPTVSVKITPGFEGEQIQWLRQRIAIAENRRLTSISQSLSFDEALVEKVKHFQQSRFLDVDGIVGNETLLYLYNVVADENTPILTQEAN